MKIKIVIIVISAFYLCNNVLFADSGINKNLEKTLEYYNVNFCFESITNEGLVFCDEIDVCNETASTLINMLVPPVNDICTGATDLGVLDCGYSGQFDEHPEATPDPEATGNCIDDTEPAQWYTFTTPDPLNYSTILFNMSGISTEIFKTSTDCDALEYVDCGVDIFPFSPEPATTYYLLKVGGQWMYTSAMWTVDCENTFFDFDLNAANPYTSTSSTDCAPANSLVPCGNDHTVWYGYVSGCNESDLTISLGETTSPHYISAGEVSITAVLDDCATLAFDYDVNGLGYVCSAMSGESLVLENIPPGTSISIAFGTTNANVGAFDYTLVETTESDEIPNEICDDVEEILDGLNEILSNLCSTLSGGPSDPPISGCSVEATTWYEYDPGNIPQDITINLISTGIISPAIAVYQECIWTAIASTCDDTFIEIFCVDEPIKIQIGSSISNAGNFDLEITSTPSGSEVIPDITGDNICSNEISNIAIDIPSGDIVDIEVVVSPSSSNFITGMNDHSFFTTSTGTINDVLVNTSTTAQEAVYSITINSQSTSCEAEPIEYTILVYPDFIVNSIAIEECLSFELVLDVNDLIEQGTSPYSSVSWYWNSLDLIESGYVLTYNLIESGQITVEVVDAVGCEESVTFDVDVSDPIPPTFDFPLEYCRSDQDFIFFATTSLENIQGFWSPSEINVAITDDGFYDILFTPDNLICTETALLTIEIYSGYLPEFDLPSLICSNQGEYTFPTEDLNGVSGNWDDPVVDVSTVTGIQTNIFTPSNMTCFTVYEYIYEVSDNLELTFGQPDSLCNNEPSITLNDVSDDGYSGTWDDPVIDPSQISEDSIIIVWTPDPDQSPCIEETAITIHILAPITPSFFLPDELCTSDPIYSFPINDMQSISGSWSIVDIDPSTANSAIQSVFTPNDDCIDIFEWEITIIEPLIPFFSLDTSLCSLDTMFILPLMSDNGISGNWSLPSIDPMTFSGDKVLVEFIGESLDTCIETINLTFEVIEAEVPIFSLPDTICWMESDIILPSNSMNEIDGTWEPSMIDVQSNLGENVDFTFTPSEDNCAASTTYSVEVLAPYSVLISISDPSDCLLEDGSISIDAGSTINLEYSIDAGMTWQVSSEFNSLSSGGYIVSIRSTESADCVLEEAAFLNAVDAPVINEVLSSNIESCIVQDGSILVNAEGNDLEYSIDGSVNWQISNEFNDLAPGEYIIRIREKLSDCVVEANATIEDVIQTELIQLNTLDISDCNAGDGWIEIIALGESLEYSIDNGASWSSQNLFENLSSGDYSIIVQSTIAADCAVESFAMLSAPATPEIVDIVQENPTVCATNIGRIEVDAIGDNLEYSFDGGVTWQSSNFIDNAIAGSYEIIVRNAERIQCLTEDVVLLVLAAESLEESIFMITPPTDCDLSDGAIEIINATSDLEFSVDGGVVWQDASLFDNLTSGIYTLWTRVAALPDCNVEQSIEIPDVDCDCQNLIIDFVIDNIPCGDEESASIDLVSIEGMEDMNIVVMWQDGSEGSELTDVGQGWQFYTILYDGLCEWKDSIYVDNLSPISFEWNIENTECPDLNNGVIEIININGGTGNYEYSIDGVSFQSDNMFTDLSEGSYDIIVQDDASCMTIESVEVEASETIEIELPNIEMISNDESIILDPDIEEQLVDSFSWSPVDGVINNEGLTLEILPEMTTTYLLEIFYGDCYDSESVVVEVEEEETGIYFANIFSPNGDNINDLFYVQGNLNRQTTLDNISVYDRWGSRIFNRSNPQINVKEDGWDGIMNGQKMNPGVYVYALSYTENGVEKIEISTVTLVN